MYRLLRSFFICLGVICTIASLSPPGTALDNAARHGARPADLEGRSWQISNYFLDKEQTEPFRRIGQKGDAYLSFAGGVFEGSPGCGRFTGTYHMSNAQLTISARWTDQKGTVCGGDEKKNAEQILRTFTNVRRVLVAPVYWHSEPAEITFLHGRVEGSPGCGAWEGTYKISGDCVTVQAGWVLAGFCFPAGFEQDRLVEAAFKGELRVEKAGASLLLRDEHGNARILLVPY